MIMCISFFSLRKLAPVLFLAVIVAVKGTSLSSVFMTSIAKFRFNLSMISVHKLSCIQITIHQCPLPDSSASFSVSSQSCNSLHKYNTRSSLHPCCYNLVQIKGRISFFLFFNIEQKGISYGVIVLSA